MTTFEENRQRARQVFLDAPKENPGHIATGNTGEVKFALLPQVDDAGDDYLMARWEEECYRAGPNVDWLEYGKNLTFWFRGQPLQLFKREHPKALWDAIDGLFILEEPLQFSIETEKPYRSQNFDLKQEQPLPMVKQSDRLWAVKFRHFYGHHYGWFLQYYDMTVDLNKMEVKYLYTSEFDSD